MLRRKFMFALGPLVLLLLITAMVAVILLQRVVLELGGAGADPFQVSELTGRFRWLVLVMAAVFIVEINIAVLVLMHMAKIVIRPVDALISATDELAHENFGHRVKLRGHDEFAHLGNAFNDLAERLAGNEQRKVEMLHQAAVTLNHELNNAGAIINLQLQLISRKAAHSAAFEKSLQEIRHSLQKMTDTVDAMKHVRRIVLTDYTPGTKMLDLSRSMEPADEALTHVTN